MSLNDGPDGVLPDEHLAGTLLREVPLLRERCTTLATESGQMPAAAEVVEQAAALVRESVDEDSAPSAAQVLDVIEELLADTGPEGAELVAYCFLDAIGPGVIDRAAASFGPLTEQLWADLECGTIGDDEPDDSAETDVRP